MHTAEMHGAMRNAAVQVGGLPKPWHGFTLVELLVVIAIIGTLVGLLLPAVQRARESGRRMACSNNVKQMGVGVTSYEGARRFFPPGNDNFTPDKVSQPRRQHAWSSFILPYIEQASLAAKIDYKKVWNAPGGNDVASDVVLPLYVCPSGITRFPGKQDYGGITGYADSYSEPRRNFSERGIFLNTSYIDSSGPGDPEEKYRPPVRGAMVTDGLSKTVLVAEAVDRSHDGGWSTPATEAMEDARWACGTNIVCQNSRVINDPNEQSFRSLHPGGVNCLFGDGHVAFLQESVDAEVLYAICTRDGGEPLAAGL